MDKKSVLITGCSSGIGYAAAKELKGLGYIVFATARKEEDVNRLREEGFESFLLDLTKAETIESALNEVLKLTRGTLYALFNNGAYGQPGAVEDISTPALKEMFETNFFGWHELTRRVLPIMRKQGYGRIIQNSSVLGIISLRFRGAYNASKYAIEGLTDTLRLELSNTDIYISLIEPGPITSNFRNNAYEKFRKNIDIRKSHFSNEYKKTIERFENKRGKDPFELPPEAVVKKVLHALESKKPKARYYVTLPTYFFGYLKRALPASWLDKILLRAT